MTNANDVLPGIMLSNGQMKTVCYGTNAALMQRVSFIIRIKATITERSRSGTTVRKWTRGRCEETSGDAYDTQRAP